MTEDLHKSAHPRLFCFAQENRKSLTNAETILWETLRRRRFKGIKFRRQHPIADFIADFYCHDHKLVIEIDGGYHTTREQSEYDQRRTFELEDMGITVIRFTNNEIINNLDFVLASISKFCLKSQFDS